MPSEFIDLEHTTREWDAAFEAIAGWWRAKGFGHDRLPLGWSILGRSIEHRFYESGHMIVSWKLTPWLFWVKFEEHVPCESYLDLPDWDQFAWRTKEAIWCEVTQHIQRMFPEKANSQNLETPAKTPAVSQQEHTGKLLASTYPELIEGSASTGPSTSSGHRSTTVPASVEPGHLILNETQTQAILVYVQAIWRGDPTGQAIRNWGQMDESHVTRLVRRAIKSGQLLVLLQE